MPGTPARSGGRVLVGSGVLAIIVTGAGLATLVGVATPAQAAEVPVEVSPSVAMPGLAVTFTVKCGQGVKSATLYGKTINLNGPVAMKTVREGVYGVTVNLPTGMSPGVYQAVAGCENGDFGTVDLTVNGTPQPSPTPPPPPPPTRRPVPPPPTAAPITGDGATSLPGGMGTGAVAGLSLVGAGAVGGFAAIRRFRRRP